MTDVPSASTKHGPFARWTPKLGKQFCPVSSFFLQNYSRLALHAGQRGLNNTEAMLIIQILDFKWGSKAPHPTLSTLAKRMGLSRRAIRSALASLEASGYVHRELSSAGGATKYHFDGLYIALEKLMAQAIEAKDEEAA